MIKEIGIVLVIIGIVLVIIVALFFFLFFGYLGVKNEIDRNNFCEKNGIEDCKVNPIECFNDCKKLNLEYFKYDSGKFGSSECWCKINGETKQIW